MTTSHYILKVAMPGNAPLFKERLMMRIGVYMHRIKLMLLCACMWSLYACTYAQNTGLILRSYMEFICMHRVTAHYGILSNCVHKAY